MNRLFITGVIHQKRKPILENFLVTIILFKEDDDRTSEHPRWGYNENHYGLDLFNFNVLPAGERRDSFFDFILVGSTGLFWSSTRTTSSRYAVSFGFTSSSFTFTTPTSDNLGFSLRLFRYATELELNEPDGHIIQSAYTGNDGEIYDGVKIGEQIWTTKNLIETKYADDTTIPIIEDVGDWDSDTDGASCVYPYQNIDGLDTEQEVIDAYGRLYNRHAVVNTKKIANGIDGDWFLPSRNELRAMLINLHLFGVGDFDKESTLGSQYASSTESSSGTMSWKIQFNNGIEVLSSKGSSTRVRQCRSFTGSTGNLYNLRDRGPENGWIFHIQDEGGGVFTYYEAGEFDLTDGTFYSNIENQPAGATGAAIGTGKANTEAIISQTGHEISAALLTTQFTRDWHVPMVYEFVNFRDYLINNYSEINIDNVGRILKSSRTIDLPPISIENGEVNILTTTKFTNIDGEAEFSLQNGDYQYTVNKFEYLQKIGNFTVDGEPKQLDVEIVKDFPNVITFQPNNVEDITATLLGRLTNEGSSSLTSRGFCWNKTGNPTINDDFIQITSNGNAFKYKIPFIFDEEDTYYVKSYATNNQGTSYGEEFEINTLEPFEFELSLKTIEKDDTFNTSEHPRWAASANVTQIDAFKFNALPSGFVTTTGSFSGIGTLTAIWVGELTGGNRYRYVLGNTGSDFNEGSFSQNFGIQIRIVRDITLIEEDYPDGYIIKSAYTGNDGQTYDGVKIGELIWITRDLIETKYADDTLIPDDLDNTQWSNDTEGAVRIYPHTLVAGIDSDEEMVEKYGRLYNGYVIDNEKGLIDENSDWRVPTRVDFTDLKEYIIDNYNHIFGLDVNRSLLAFGSGFGYENNIGDVLKSGRQINSNIKPYVFDADVSINGITGKTYAFGRTNINLPDGTYNYSVNKHDYDEVTGSTIIFREGEFIEVELEKSE